MGQCFLYGNGAASGGLKIVTGLSEPASPREGMVWVKSEAAGKKYVFAETEPEAPGAGLIWFYRSQTALKVAYVYGDSAWEMVDASVYENGAWRQFSWKKRYLIQDGVPNVEFVAIKAQLQPGVTTYTPTAPTIAGTTGDGYYRVYQSGSAGVLKAGIVITKEAIPLAGFKALHIVAKTSAASGYSQSCGLFDTAAPAALSSNLARVSLPLNGQAEAEKILEITEAMSGELYVGLNNYSYGATYNIWVKNLWLE